MMSESMVLGRRNTVLATVIGAVLASYAGSASALYGTIGSMAGAVAAGTVSALQGHDARTLCTVMAVCSLLSCLRSRFLREDD